MADIGRFDISPDADGVARTVAEWFMTRAAAAAPFRVAFSGGSTPKALFELLAQPANARRLNWSNLHLFWGDERFVPYDSPDSNYGAARRLLFDYVQMPQSNIHPMPTDGAPDSAAAAYAQTLRAEYGATELDPARPLFDIVFLGLGDDGHTASLIPGQPVLNERKKWVAAVGAGRPEVRLTLTYPALESARSVAFLVTGAAKRPILDALRAGTADVPAAHLHPAGETIFFTDRAAAGN